MVRSHFGANPGIANALRSGTLLIMKTSTTPDLSALSVTEKLRVIESLWADLEKTPERVPSPAWHGEVLEELAVEYKAGKLKFRPLSEVKKTLRAKRA